MIVRNFIDDSSDSIKENKCQVHSIDMFRLYYLYGEADTKNCAEIACNILCINREDDEAALDQKSYVRKPIHIFINSRGGNVMDMWSLIDLIESSATPVYTYCNGYAMSAAFQIFLAGHKRFMTPNATLMYHQIYCWRKGKYQDLVEEREHMDYLNSQIEQYIMSKTVLSEEELTEIRKLKKDTYFNAQRALNLKMVDEVVQRISII